MPNVYELRKEWGACTRCGLHETRKNLVFGLGNPSADILIIGGEPGETENETGIPFKGEAGEILNQFLDAVELDREKDCFITNVVCCRPTQSVLDDRTKQERVENRAPYKDEREACRPRLLETIYCVDPLIIVAVGKVPAQALLSKGTKMADQRGRVQTLHLAGRGIEIQYPVISMYNTAFLNRTHDKRPEGPWGKTMEDWVKVCNAVDYLREVYYGISKPQRGESNEGETKGKKGRKRR